MQKRTLKVAILAALAIILVLSFSSVALADQTWSDLPDTVTAKYGITDNQVAAISDGFAGGLWKPNQPVTRAQFTKMAVMAFGVDLANPATASFTDVAKTNAYYAYIEGAKAAGLINGTTATAFSPNINITRQQAIAIISRYVAMVNDFDLATMYTADEIADLLSHFGDAASISTSLKAEMAFAFDMGITKGNAFGDLVPLANLIRIQAAAMLIRAQGLVPPANWTAAKIELVSADKSENLIGQVHQATFKVTTADGHPAKGVLVDFDTLTGGPFEVGNISAQAAMTNDMGEVTINLISTEPGTQRVSAAVSGLTAIYMTKYWLALDEVYITDLTREAENNAGEDHTWGARVVVFGPGPLSTSVQDWYNAITTDDIDMTNIDPDDGIDDGGGWDYEDELDLLADGYVPRTMAGITVEWSIVPVSLLVDSVGSIVEVDGVAITPAQSANGTTDADGFSSITISSTEIGQTVVQAIATYVGNPYPKNLFDHDTFNDDWDHNIDWQPQPRDEATAIKTWIPHVIGGDSDAPIVPAYAVNNTGEVETFTLTLEDVYGNPIEGYTVEWWLQGAGFFKTDGSTWVGIGEQNKDLDVTDAAGQADVQLKSLTPGQTILHCKVMDKFGLPYKEWNVVKQWYSIDDIDLGLDATGEFANEVNTGHTFTAVVSGAKLVFTMYDINKNGLRDDEVLIGDRAELKAAGGFIVNMNGTDGVAKVAGDDLLPGQVLHVNGAFYTRFADMELGDAEFWNVDLQGIDTVWSYLAGKTVYFFNNIGRGSNPVSNTPLDTISGEGFPEFVGTITSVTPVVTDAMGEASVDINSLNKGYQYIYAVADYVDNPQDGDPLMPLLWAELRWDVAVKQWLPAGGDSIEIFAQGDVAGDRWVNPVLPWGTGTTGPETNPNIETIAVQVFDEFGNALPDYKVTWEVVGQGTVTAGSEDTYHPYAHFVDANHDGQDGEIAGVGDLQEHVNSNLLWENQVALDDLTFPWDGDDDWAWGWTENHLIDFELGLVSAANVTLVLDETLGQLQDGGVSGEEGIDHFTNIVNIRVYTPAGALMDEFEVTKVWTLEAPTLTTIVLEQLDEEGTDEYTTDLITVHDVDPTSVSYRAMFLDQFGNPMDLGDLTAEEFDVLLDSDVPGEDQIIDFDVAAIDLDMWYYLDDVLAGPGTITATLWWDNTPENDVINTAELKSNAVIADVILETP